MNQAEISKLVSKLKIKEPTRLRKFRNPKGPEGRLDKLRKTVTALIKHERIELNLPRADEARMYTERLISDAIRYGDCHKTTMEMANFWIMEKQLIHKLFKVLAPRYEHYNVSCTRMLNAPRTGYEREFRKAVLELRGNPYPSLVPESISNKYFIHNVLLEEAKKAYRTRKYAEIAAKVDAAESQIGIEPEKPNNNSDNSDSFSEDSLTEDKTDPPSHGKE